MPMVQSTQKPIVVARISFESTRLSPQCLAETYARIVPITRKVIRAAPEPRQRPSPGRPQRGGLSMAECRAAFYARVSSEAQARDKPIASQVAALRERIAADGVTMLPDAAYLDEGHSGSSLVRPALERLRDAVAAGDIDRVYV